VLTLTVKWKGLADVNVDVHEILRRYAPLDDIGIKLKYYIVKKIEGWKCVGASS
jgi:hypothetical protein